MKSRIKGSSIHNPESSNKRIYLFVHSPFFPIFAPESLKQAYNMNIKLHTPNSLKAGSGMSTMKQFLLALLATTVSIVLTFGTAGFYYECPFSSPATDK